MKKFLLSALTFITFTLSYIPNATAVMPATLSDGEGAEVMVTINEGEIDLGQLAKRKANSKQVKDYAKMMVDQHKQNEKDIKRVVRKQDLDFKKTDTSKSLEAQAEDMEKTLKKTAKDDFDRAYMNQQVARHEKALNTVNSLIASAQNAAFKEHLEKTRDAITVHLAHAKEVQAMIGTISATQTTTSTMMPTELPGEVTTVNPMDPLHDSRRATDSQMLDIRRKRRAMVPPASATSFPIESAPSY